MKIKYYGTAAAEGQPALFCDCKLCEKVRKLRGKNIRTRSQACIDDKILIDLPADTYMHVLYGGLELHKISECLITHNHEDHLYPSELLNRHEGFSHLKNKKAFNIYGFDSVFKTIFSKSGATELFDEMLKQNEMKFNAVQPFEPFFIEDYKIYALKANHPTAQNPSFYIIEKSDKTLMYAHDTGLFPKETSAFLKKYDRKLDFISFDCTFTEKKSCEGHMGINEASQFRSELGEIGLLNDNSIFVLNHFSHNGGLLYEDFSSIAEKQNFLVSYDGLEIEF